MYDVTSGELHTNPSLCAGTMLRGRYRIEKMLGQGGFGITYAALDTKYHQRVAIKELFPSLCVVRSQNHQTVSILPDQEETFLYLRESFEKEANTLIQLQNQEGVVRLMHVFSENNTMYYVMELLEGEDLKHRLARDGVLSWEQLAPILKTVMNALEQIHKVGLIHRDISPDNIFLTKTGARLIDFGSVRNYQVNTNLTTMVKRNFAPYEQYSSSGHQGPWTDVYSLAVTAYFALTGKLPPPATVRKVHDELVPLDTLCPELPRHVRAAIHGGMIVLPENRFQSIQQFSHALKLEEKYTQQQTMHARIVCLRGNFVGKSWFLQPDTVLRIGRNLDCTICYPAGYPGVSRNQCEVFQTRDGLSYVRDCNSRYGTRLKSTEKNVVLEPNTWYRADGAHILFGAQEEYVLMR